MSRPSDREYILRRKIKDLEEQLANRDLEIKSLKKQIAKVVVPVDENPKKKKKAVPKDEACPDCGSSVNKTELPHATMQLCKAACGWRKVINK